MWVTKPESERKVGELWIEKMGEWVGGNRYLLEVSLDWIASESSGRSGTERWQPQREVERWKAGLAFSPKWLQLNLASQLALLKLNSIRSSTRSHWDPVVSIQFEEGLSYSAFRFSPPISPSSWIWLWLTSEGRFDDFEVWDVWKEIWISHWLRSMSFWNISNLLSIWLTMTIGLSCNFSVWVGSFNSNVSLGDISINLCNSSLFVRWAIWAGWHCGGLGRKLKG